MSRATPCTVFRVGNVIPMRSGPKHFLLIIDLPLKKEIEGGSIGGAGQPSMVQSAALWVALRRPPPRGNCQETLWVRCWAGMVVFRMVSTAPMPLRDFTSGRLSAVLCCGPDFSGRPTQGGPNNE